MSLTDAERDEVMEIRREALLAAMQDLSEECWAAGWYYGLERDLYRIVFEGALAEYGMGWIGAAERERMRQWAVLADCWWVWDDAVGGKPIAISLAEAETRFKRIPTKQVPQGLTVKEALAIYATSSADDWSLEPIIKQDVADTPLARWLHRAREIYRFKPDPGLYLRRRHDFQFVLGYGSCLIDLVQPNWLPSESFLRADGCTESAPCKQIQLCVACAEGTSIHGD